MIRPIQHDIILLGQKSLPASAEELPLARDLLETLQAHEEECVGMAANMIGVPRRIIAFRDEKRYCVMLNPVILKKNIPYEAEEGCLSLSGTRTTTRYRTIKVQWQTETMETRVKTFTGFPAQIIQHECDHLEGILI